MAPDEMKNLGLEFDEGEDRVVAGEKGLGDAREGGEGRA